MAVASSTPSGIPNVSAPAAVAYSAYAPEPTSATTRSPGVLAHARDLRAGHQRQLVARDVAVRAPMRVGEVHARERDADQHLAVRGLGHRQVDELQHLGPAVLGHLDRAHETHPSPNRRACRSPGDLRHSRAWTGQPRWRSLQYPGNQRGADEFGSRALVFGSLTLIAAFVLGAAVALGLKDDPARRAAQRRRRRRPSATVARPAPPPPVTTATTPEEDVETTPEVETTPRRSVAAKDCDDGVDNDQDDLVDASQDDGCLADGTEAPANTPGAPGDAAADATECSDGKDNDRDGFADDEDLQCPGSSESEPVVTTPPPAARTPPPRSPPPPPLRHRPPPPPPPPPAEFEPPE